MYRLDTVIIYIEIEITFNLVLFCNVFFFFVYFVFFFGISLGIHNTRKTDDHINSIILLMVDAVKMLLYIFYFYIEGLLTCTFFF